MIKKHLKVYTLSIKSSAKNICPLYMARGHFQSIIPTDGTVNWEGKGMGYGFTGPMAPLVKEILMVV